jgi:hypothetical protein
MKKRYDIQILISMLLMMTDLKIDIAYAQNNLTNTIKEGVIPIGTEHYQISLNWFKQEIIDLNQLARTGRLIPIYENSKVIGFRLVGIRKGSSADLLGLKNGDLLISISGEVLSDTEQLKKIYDWSINQSKIELKVKRQDQILAFLYEILR